MTYTTQNVIEILKTLNVRPKKSLGQNFLVNPDVCQKITDQVCISHADRFIEVGPGLGVLTEGLKHLPDLLLIERDKVFVEFLKQKGFCVLHKDALFVDWSELIKGRTILVSNLPYQISSRLLIDRSLDQVLLQKMVLMFQKEVAMRILAEPDTKSYGLLSVMAQTHWQVTKLLSVGPKDFYPAPQVGSQVLEFVPKPCHGLDSRQFLVFLKKGFAQRRKQLKKILLPLLTEGHFILKVFSDLKISHTARAEELSPQKWVDLFIAIQGFK